MISAMSDNELRCFRAAMKWQRREALQQLFQALIPRLPYREKARKQTAIVKLVYALMMLALSPVLALAWLLHAVFQLVAFPFQILSTFLSPNDLKGPGERNLQGIHNAFIPHFDLSPHYYMLCVNDWIAILYGQQTLDTHRMDKQVSVRNMALFGVSNPELNELPLRNALSQARETLSQQLGHY